jgi:hypothetical protein
MNSDSLHSGESSENETGKKMKLLKRNCTALKAASKKISKP